ncbi:hypothetical protein [Daejeonella sp.]|uniref:hypothetical protein n=1 Tax=Daejeonella sp. TaxID=2805397 RepID=UPI00398361CD
MGSAIYEAKCISCHSKNGEGYKLLKKKAGFRYVMDVIPLDADLIRGSHEMIDNSPEYQLVIISGFKQDAGAISAPEVFDII